MKILSCIFIVVCLLASCSKESESTSQPTESGVENAIKEVAGAGKVYEVGCGLCVFDSEVPDVCESYVKIDDKVMPIVGEVLDAHEIGLCEWRGTAYLVGEVKDGKFHSKSMKIKEFDKSKNYQE